MDNDKKVSVETVGEIVSVLEFNSWVYLTLKVYGEIVKVEIPRIYCNSKRLKCKDVVKIVGNIADYEKSNGKHPSRTIYSKCVVERVLRKGEKNERLDAATNFSFMGHILFAEPNDEFYQLIFELANEEKDIVTIYVDKYHWKEFRKHYDFRRLIHITCKTSITSYYKHSYDIPVSDVRNYAVSIEYV